MKVGKLSEKHLFLLSYQDFLTCSTEKLISSRFEGVWSSLLGFTYFERHSRRSKESLQGLLFYGFSPVLSRNIMSCSFFNLHLTQLLFFSIYISHNCSENCRRSFMKEIKIEALEKKRQIRNFARKRWLFNKL